MTKSFTRALLGAALLATTSTSFASFNREGRTEVGLGLGMVVPLKSDAFNRAVNEDLGGTAWFNHYISERFFINLAYDKYTYKDSDMHADNANVNLGYRFAVSQFSPYITVGGGYAGFKNFAPGQKNYDAAALVGGFGFDWYWSRVVTFTMGAKYQYVGAKDNNYKEISNVLPFVGLSFAIGNEKEESHPAPVQEPAPVVAAPVEPVRVDTDGDGIYDDEDKCLSTPAGKKVNAYGCAEAETYQQTLDVQFDTGKSVVKEEYYKDINALADFMKKYEDTNVIIEGHSDNTGSAATNKRLSSQRAEAVRKVLIDRYGIAASRVTSKGFGPSQPIADNKTAEGRAQNRRVVATVKAVVPVEKSQKQ